MQYPDFFKQIHLYYAVCNKVKYPFKICDFRLPSRSRWELRSCGLLRSEWWQFLTDISVQPDGTIIRGQESKKKIMTPETWTDRLSRNFGK